MDEWVLPEINSNRCTGCGLCVTYCPTKAVALLENRPVITRPLDCAYCGICEDMCPEDAVRLVYIIGPPPSGDLAQ